MTDRSTASAPHEVLNLDAERRGRGLRRVGLVLFTAFVLLGAAGQLGVRSSTATGADGDLRVSLRYAQVARPALAVPFRLTISRAGGFDGPIEVRISTDYLEALDENGVNPDAERMTSDSDETIWWFEPPAGDVLVVWLDTRIGPGVQWRLSGTTTVVSGDDEVTISHPTWVLP